MFRRIAVHLDQGADTAQRFDFALHVAKEFNAEIQCIYTNYVPPASWSAFAYGDYVMMSEVLEDLRVANQDQQQKAKSRFMPAVSEQGLVADWRSVEHAPVEELSAYARLSDLLIVSQENKDDIGAGDGFAERVIFSVGRPVLVLPRQLTSTTVGQRILICWDGSRESARALADAAPFLQVATDVVVLTVEERLDELKAPIPPIGELEAYFRAHSYLLAKHIHRDTHEQGVGETISRVADDQKIDLIVMGAYGHSRLREWILGGATSFLLKNTLVPVLFSH